MSNYGYRFAEIRIYEKPYVIEVYRTNISLKCILIHVLLYTLVDLLILNITVNLQNFDRLYQIMMNINISTVSSLKSLDYIAKFDKVLCHKACIYNMYM